MRINNLEITQRAGGDDSVCLTYVHLNSFYSHVFLINPQILLKSHSLESIKLIGAYIQRCLALTDEIRNKFAGT